MAKQQDWSPHLSRLVDENRALSKVVDTSNDMTPRVQKKLVGSQQR